MSIVENGRKIGSDLHVGPAKRPCHHCHGVGILLARGVPRGASVFKDCLESLADRARIRSSPGEAGRRGLISERG